MFSSFWANPHDAIKHECVKAEQRMCPDAIRYPVMNGCDFDIGQRLVVCVGLGEREIRCVGRQRQLSVEEFGARDCLFIKAPAKT